MERLFGTDGVRGVANTELTCDMAFKLGRAGAYILSGDNSQKPKILVGKDTRRSSDMLECALTAGICSAGAQAILAGVVPTPAVAYLVRKYGCDAGVVISASHNPAEFNGIKFFNSEGYKLPDEVEERIERIILDNAEEIPTPVGDQVGTVHKLNSAVEDYVDYAIQTCKTDLTGLRVALDCANGASCVTSPEAIRRLRAEVLVINNQPDGMNINKGCGSTHLDLIKKFTVENKCDIGLAFDGDADRVLAVDENGCFVDGDHMMAIIGLDLKNKGLLTHNTIVATVMSSMGFDEMARNNGLNIIKAPVGDRYVLEKMLEGGFVLGGEQSGHVILSMHNTTGDGLITALKLLSVLKESGRSLSELNAVMNDYPQVLRNARVSNDKKYSYREDPVIEEHCARLEAAFKGEGRVLIRPSGTEPLVRVMIEGKDQDYITKKAEELVRIIEERLG